MVGIVDEFGRALLRIQLRNPISGELAKLDAWLDTGFTGDLVLPEQHITTLNLPFGHAVSAGLADGSQIQLRSHSCELAWFGKWRKTQVIASKAEFPLLGVGLLLDRKLSINYRTKTLRLV